MSRSFCYCLAFSMLALLAACNKDETPVPQPIAPILKEVVLPGENELMPGREAIIKGKGFDVSDKLFIENDQAMQAVEVLSVSNQDIRFRVPREAGGAYTVTVERAGLQTTLDGELVVPFVVVLENVVVPAANQPRGGTVEIAGEGFEAGDQVQLTAAFYPQGKVITVNTTLTSNGISVVLPEEAYGINNLLVVRGQRKSQLGSIGIEVNVGDELGGGIVYYTEPGKLHGFIAGKTNVGSPVEQFGPGVALSGAAGTSKALGSGKSNSTKLLGKLASFRQSNGSWNNKKAAVEWCDEWTVTDGADTYTDWYLPSQEELIELFKVKTMMANLGAGLPANNYWSSSEGDGDAAGWSAFYVNFYEAVNIVSGNSDKEGWKIGIRAIRSF